MKALLILALAIVSASAAFASDRAPGAKGILLPVVCQAKNARGIVFTAAGIGTDNVQGMAMKKCYAAPSAVCWKLGCI